MRGDFVLITTLGHSGSKWLVNALHMPGRGLCIFHERARHMFPRENRFCENMRHQFERGSYTAYRSYFRAMRCMLKDHRVVGDCHAWFYWGLDTVAQHLPVKRAVHLVRNGIMVVGSYISGFAKVGMQEFWNDRFRWYWQTRSKKPAPEHWPIFEKVCFIWDSCQRLVPPKLTALLGAANTQVRRLEDLANHPGKLHGLACWLSPGLELDANHFNIVAQQDHNRHTKWYTNAERTPQAYWKRWTKRERQAFKRHCGATMQQLGYGLGV